MILLEFHNRIIEEVLIQKLNEDTSDKESKRTLLDFTIADFDGVQYHIHNDPEARQMLTVSMQWPACTELMKQGAKADLPRIYGSMNAAPEPGYDVTLKIDCDAAAKDQKLPRHIAMLKRNVFAAPFKRIFASIEQGKPMPDVINIPYRSEENVYLKTSPPDGVFVIFKVGFKDPADQVLGKLFLQEFADARKSLRGCPAVTYYIANAEFPTPPELEGVSGVEPVESGGYISFNLFKNHTSAKVAARTINIIQTFRNYFHYHIKCAKAYMHNRMRFRVSELLKILNRARTVPFEAPKMKTMSGKTFVRKDK